MCSLMKQKSSQVRSISLSSNQIRASILLMTHCSTLLWMLHSMCSVECFFTSKEVTSLAYSNGYLFGVIYYEVWRAKPHGEWKKLVGCCVGRIIIVGDIIYGLAEQATGDKPKG